MEINEVFKVALAEYKFGGSVFYRILNNDNALELDFIHVDNEKPNLKVQCAQEPQLQELLDELANTWCAEFNQRIPTAVSLGMTKFVIRKIQLQQFLPRNHAAAIIYKEEQDGKYTPERLLLWYIIEVVDITDALQTEIEKMFPYAEE